MRIWVEKRLHEVRIVERLLKMRRKRKVRRRQGGKCCWSRSCWSGRLWWWERWFPSLNLGDKLSGERIQTINLL